MTTLPTSWLEHKTLMSAMLLLTRRIGEDLEVDATASIAEICRTLGANRTSVYEQLERLTDKVQELVDARPGRPTAQTPKADEELAQLRLTVRVLELRLRHPGCAVEHEGRTTYADVFRRFLLEHKDRWPGSLESFSHAVGVPTDTLRDWLRDDRREALQTPPKKRPPLPVDASQLTRQVVDEWMNWVGPARPFIGYAAGLFELSPQTIARLMKILGIISPRSRRPPRYRGSTQSLTPGTLLVTDGKWITVRLLDTQQELYFNWQGIVDQTTACDTATVLTEQEDADAVRQAYEQSVKFLGGCVPQALLHDNKPCYDEQALRRKLDEWGTQAIHATPGRPQNKAVLEGAFGLFEQRVGSMYLDDTSEDTLIQSAVREAIRAHTAATNAVPRIELDGKSRLQALQQACPTQEQQKRDQAFLAGLRANHPRKRKKKPHPDSIALIEHIFERFDLLSRRLRQYLATFQPEAIRRAAAIFASKVENHHIDMRYAHRYLTQLIRHQQDELDLQRAADELLELTRRQQQNWNHREEQEFELLNRQRRSLDELTRAVAERAAHGGIPLQATFWTRKLLEMLRQAAHLVEDVKRFLIRLYEAPKQQRLVLLDLIIAQQHGLIGAGA